MKDWTGNKRTLGATVGASSHTSEDRQREDNYATNPPYATALEFVERALRLVKPGANVWMLLKLSFLEGQSRKRLFNDTPPMDVWVFSERRTCAKNGDFARYKQGAMAYAWFHWIKKTPRRLHY